MDFLNTLRQTLPMPIVTLTTDFGQNDHYVAAMKGIILQIAPRTTLVDVTHQIARHDVVQAAFVIRAVWPSFPRGTIHVVVVDPEVGTARRLIAAQYGGQFLLCPDNGIASCLQRDAGLEILREIGNRGLFVQQPTSTFHGRDILAPAAGHLARGGKITDLGPPTDHIEMLNLPRPERMPDHSVHGQVVYVDGFGNMVTNLSREELAHTLNVLPGAHVWLGDHDIGPLRQTYAQVEVGAAIALIGSVGLLEIAVNRGSASEVLAARIGSPVTVK